MESEPQQNIVTTGSLMHMDAHLTVGGIKQAGLASEELSQKLTFVLKPTNVM